MDDAPLHSLLPLSDDPGQLRSLVLTLVSQRDLAIREREGWKRKHDEKEQARQKLEVEKQRLELRLLLLLRQRYGRKADRLRTPGDVAQLLLDFAKEGLVPLPEATVEDAAAIADDATPVDLTCVELKTVRQVRPARRGGRGGRLDLSQCHHLPLIRQEYDLPEGHKPCPCCGTLRERIGSESAWQLEIIPAILQRIEHVRLKYGCSWCERNGHNPQIELAGKPASPIDKGLPGPGLLAHVVTGKFADYLPLYRLEQQFAREGLAIGRATMSVWCRDVARLLTPLHRLMVERVKQSGVVCTDDTTMPMQDPGRGKVKQARMWVYVGDEAHPYDVFDFTLGRGRDGPAKFLGDFGGTLLADAYVGYDAVVTGNDLVRAGCWAHARRKFIELESMHPGIAKEVVDLIGKLYAIERRGKAMNAGDRLAMRRKESLPLLEELHHRLSSWQLQLLPKHPMQQAIGYVLRQWKELTVFASDPAVPIDNNVSEREMKRIVLNRKNSLFVGNEQGGHTAAILAGFTSTCRRHDIDPRAYLTQLLTNLPDTPMSQLEAWLPDRWKQRQLQPDTS